MLEMRKDLVQSETRLYLAAESGSCFMIMGNMMCFRYGWFLLEIIALCYRKFVLRVFIPIAAHYSMSLINELLKCWGKLTFPCMGRKSKSRSF